MSLWHYDYTGKLAKSSLKTNTNPNAWAILACPGPSLKLEDPSTFNGAGRTVFAMNTAYPFVRPDIWIGLDDPACFDRGLPHESFVKVFSGPQKAQPVSKVGSLNTHFANISTDLTSAEMDLDPESNKPLYFNGSTFCTALHLILKMGFRRIALAGCDLSLDGGDYHHNGKLEGDRRTTNAKLYADITTWMLHYFIPNSSQIGGGRGIELVNTCKGSTLEPALGYKSLAALLSRIDLAIPKTVGPPRHSLDVQAAREKKALYVRGHHGLGDSYYQWPVIKKLCESQEVILETPWPQLYCEIEGLRFAAPSQTLRTQALSINSHRHLYTDSTRERDLQISYTQLQAQAVPIYTALCMSAGISPAGYTITQRGPREPQEKLAIIRPATLRKEWRAASRNCRQDYIVAIARGLRAVGWQTLLVANLQEGEEVLDGPIDESVFSEVLTHGPDLTDLFARASLVVSPVGFAAPMAMALSVPSLIVHGGAGGWNHPKIIDAPSTVPCSHILPNNYCQCQDHDCPDCDKTIDEDRIVEAINNSIQPTTRLALA